MSGHLSSVRRTGWLHRAGWSGSTKSRAVSLTVLINCQNKGLGLSLIWCISAWPPAAAAVNFPHSSQPSPDWGSTAGPAISCGSTSWQLLKKYKEKKWIIIVIALQYQDGVTVSLASQRGSLDCWPIYILWTSHPLLCSLLFSNFFHVAFNYGRHGSDVCHWLWFMPLNYA